MMKWSNSFLMITLLIFNLAYAEVEITVPSTVEVSPRSEISMYDVVETKNLDDSTLKQLQEIIIADKAETTLLRKMDLARHLRSVKAKFILPNELKIIRSRGQISRLEVERKIKNKIDSECSGCEVQVMIANVPQNFESDWALDLNIDLNKKNVMIPVYSVGNSSQKGWIAVEIKRYQKVPVLNQPLKVGDVVTPEMLVFEKRELVNMRNTFMSLESLEGMQAVRFLNAGQVVQFGDVKKETVLKKGQMVKAVFGSSSFEVAISAEAQEGGSVGDVVKIKNLDSQKVFAAKIVERGVVRIE